MTTSAAWIGSAQPGWTVEQGRRHFSNRKELNARGADAQVLSLTLRGVVRNDPDAPEGLVPTDYNSYQVFGKDDLVFKLIDLENRRTSRVGLVPERGIMSPAYIRLIPKSTVVPRYAYWHYYSLWTRDVFNELGGGVRATLSAADLLALPIALPPVEEQRRIADFLDDHVARIDEAVGVRSKQLGLLEELRWAEFERELGALEKSRAPLGRFLKLVADGPFGSAFSSDDYVDDGPAVIRLGDIGPDEFRGVDLARIPYRIYDQFPRCRIRPGELLVASLGEGKNHAGRACVVPEDIGPAMVKGKCFRVVVDESLAVPRFLAMLLSSPMAAKIFELQSRGSTMQMINIGLLRETRFPMPDMVGQERLMRDQVRRAQQLDAASEQVAQSIQLLEERKRSLITAAVTGELDVTTAKPIGMGKWVPNVGASVEAPAAAQSSGIGGIG